MRDHSARHPSRAKVISAFAAIYLIWGSTYLAILFALETMPPFIMAGARFLAAGAVLYVWSRARGARRAGRAEWVTAAIVGALLLFGGNGAVVWAEQRVPSGIAALLVSTVPVWMVLLDWLRPGGRRPGAAVIAGLLLGLVGIALLIGPGVMLGGGSVDALGAAVLIVGSLSWALGSLYSKYAAPSAQPRLATAMQMLAGGAILAGVGILGGEQARLELAQISATSALALLYLIVFGSLIGYSAYVWLLSVSSPAKVSTYAYVNPVVAVLLGWAFAGEALAARTLIAAAIIVAAVALITTARAVGGDSSRPVVPIDHGEASHRRRRRRPVVPAA